jgi:hypothetical protein
VGASQQLASCTMHAVASLRYRAVMGSVATAAWEEGCYCWHRPQQLCAASVGADSKQCGSCSTWAQHCTHDRGVYVQTSRAPSAHVVQTGLHVGAPGRLFFRAGMWPLDNTAADLMLLVDWFARGSLSLERSPQSRPLSISRRHCLDRSCTACELLATWCGWAADG